jgi:transcription initiation factor TFIID TATA-box-binding protein
MRKRRYVSLDAEHGGEDEEEGDDEEAGGEEEEAATDFPVPQCHNIVSTSQIVTSQPSINLQRLADLFPFTTYDRKRFAAITIRLANPHCTCLLFGSGKLVITGSTSFSACIVASHEITRILRSASPRDTFEVSSCQIQNLVAHVSLRRGTTIDLDRLYERFNEQSTYQRSIFPGLVLRPPRSPIVLLIFTSGRIVCTGGRSYQDIYYGFRTIFQTLKPYISFPTIMVSGGGSGSSPPTTKRRKKTASELGGGEDGGGGGQSCPSGLVVPPPPPRREEEEAERASPPPWA